jgi:hypothetical protein
MKTKKKRKTVLRLKVGQQIWVRNNATKIWHSAKFIGRALFSANVYNLSDCPIRWCYREDIRTEKPRRQYVYLYQEGGVWFPHGAFSTDREAIAYARFLQMDPDTVIEKRREVRPLEDDDLLRSNRPWVEEIATSIENKSFLVKRKSVPLSHDPTTLWLAWEVEGGFAFRVNNGRTLGSTGTLSTEDFWKEFEGLPQATN